MPYRHKIIEGLAQLIEEYGGKSDDIVMKSIWWGIKGQVPSLLQGLDDNEEAIAEIEAKLREVLGISPVIEQVKEIEEEAIGQTEAPEEKEVKTKDKKKKGKRKATKE